MIVYAHGPKLNNKTGMARHACFYFRGKKKEKSTKKKNEHGDIYMVLINFMILCKIHFKEILFFVSVVLLYDIFCSRFKQFLAIMFCYKIDFSLKNKLHAYFSLVFVSFY